MADRENTHFENISKKELEFEFKGFFVVYFKTNLGPEFSRNAFFKFKNMRFCSISILQRIFVPRGRPYG